MNSGVTAPPPSNRKRPRTGMSSWNGAPSTSHTASGSSTIAPSATGHTRGRSPVAFWMRVARRAASQVATPPATKASAAHECAGCQISVGARSPLLDR